MKKLKIFLGATKNFYYKKVNFYSLKFLMGFTIGILAIFVVGLIIFSARLSLPGEEIKILTFPKRQKCVTKIEERVVRGSSLFPIIKPGQIVKLLFGYYNCHQIKEGDIVAYSYAGRKDPIIKIVKALPGDSLYLRDCNLLRNGEILKNSEGKPYCFAEKRKKMLGLYTGAHISGYLILGNKVEGSLDSSRFGLVSKNNILGKINY